MAFHRLTSLLLIILGGFVLDWHQKAEAEVVVSARTDHLFALSGTYTPHVAVDFAEAVYVAANLLDASCLLRYPDGSYGLVFETVVADPEERGDGKFKVSVPMDKYKGGDTCQFQFAFVRLWLRTNEPEPDKRSLGFLAFVPLGSPYDGTRVAPATSVDKLICRHEPTGKSSCALQLKNQEVSRTVGIPMSGVAIDNFVMQLSQ